MFVALNGASISSAKKLNDALCFSLGEIRVSPAANIFSPVTLREGIPFGDGLYNTLYFLKAQAMGSTDDRVIEFPKEYISRVKTHLVVAVKRFVPDARFKIGFLEELD